MLYSKKFTQKTVMAKDPETFDRLINAIYDTAARSQREPEIHYFDGMGLCATVRYYEMIEIPETASERFIAAGEAHTCADCEHYRPPFDGRVKWVKCAEGGCLAGRTSPACEYHYEELERRRERVSESHCGTCTERNPAQAAR